MKKIFFVLIVLGLFLVACQTGEPEAPAAEEMVDDTAAGSDAEPEGPPDEPAPEQDSVPEPEESESAVDELMEFFAKKGGIEYMVTYDLVADSAGTRTESEMTMYTALPGRIRTDVVAQGVEARTFMVDETFTSCTNNDGWTCLQMDFTASQSDQVLEDVEENTADYDISPLLPKTVAGTLAACFRITAEDATVDYCFSKEGVPLFVKSVGEYDGESFSSEMTATSYSTSVPGDAFDLPAEPTDMGDYADLLAQYT